ncbi:hypothetical protein [Clostridium botulinum]|uniref:hypothetical protein n=1 Tax=Clostridium botulinum TaxID=1491 RepID=UPI001C9A433D|nr:hypothetical protein [Clostridium botulinum]MBY6842662.1 hypothetical protein [Clostridium botulinum]
MHNNLKEEYCKGYLDGFKEGYKKAMENDINLDNKDFQPINPCPHCGRELNSKSVIKYNDNNDIYGMSDSCTMAIKHYCKCGYEKIEEC